MSQGIRGKRLELDKAFDIFEEVDRVVEDRGNQYGSYTVNILARTEALKRFNDIYVDIKGENLPLDYAIAISDILSKYARAVVRYKRDTLIDIIGYSKISSDVISLEVKSLSAQVEMDKDILRRVYGIAISFVIFIVRTKNIDVNSGENTNSSFEEVIKEVTKDKYLYSLIESINYMLTSIIYNDNRVYALLIKPIVGILKEKGDENVNK